MTWSVTSSLSSKARKSGRCFFSSRLWGADPPDWDPGASFPQPGETLAVILTSWDGQSGTLDTWRRHAQELTWVLATARVGGGRL